MKVGQFEFRNWKVLHDSHGNFHVRLRNFDDFFPDAPFEFARSEICLFEPSRNRDENWSVEFYGRFGESFEKWERTIDFLPTDTSEEAKKKVDDLLIRLSKLESFE